MLWILFGMNVWWFQYILLVLIRAVTGTSRGLEDSRDIPKPKLADGKMDNLMQPVFVFTSLQ